MKDNSLMEFNLTNILNILMWILFGAVVYMLYKNGADLKPELFIALSALTASVAMSRSVYATKVSDKVKMDIERQHIRIDIYGEAQKLAIRIGDNNFTAIDLEDIVVLTAKAKLYFNNDIALVNTLLAIGYAGLDLADINGKDYYITEQVARDQKIESIGKDVETEMKIFADLCTKYIDF